MTLVTGTVRDLGNTAMSGTLWARPSRFRSGGSVLLAPERRPFPVVNGAISAELAPGPATLELEVGSHSRGIFEVNIPDQETVTLNELLAAP